MPTARYSRLAPLALEQRVQITLAALNFFSPMSYEKVSAAIDRPPTPGRTEPLDGGDFLKYLERTGTLPGANRYLVRLRELLGQLEAAGLLTFMGQGRDVLIGKRYYFMKELTTLEKQGTLWLASALGPEFLYAAFSGITVQVTGVNQLGDVYAGTALAIAPNWLLTCAHVLTDMAVHDEQSFNSRPHRIVRSMPHPSVDVGPMEIEPALQVPPSLAFRDPILSESLFTFGYPRVPLAREPSLVMQRGEVTSTQVTLLDGREVFLYSAAARPGNSGGPVLSHSGHVLGIVTEQLADDGLKQALPFYAGISAATISTALTDIEPSIRLPMERYE